MRKIIFITLALHCCLLLTALFSSPFLVKKQRLKPLVVRSFTPKTVEKTTRASPPIKESRSTPKKPSPPPSPQKPQKKTLPSKTDQKKPAVKKAPAPKPAPKTSQKNYSEEKSSVPEHLLRELEETIAKIDGNREILYSGKKLDALPDLKALSHDITLTSPSAADTGYRETLVVLLKESLNLPDYGEVKIELTLRKDGSVKKVKIINTESEKNRKYLEKQLNCMRFPPLSGSFDENNEQTYTLTFCNQI